MDAMVAVAILVNEEFAIGGVLNQEEADRAKPLCKFN